MMKLRITYETFMNFDMSTQLPHELPLVLEKNIKKVTFFSLHLLIHNIKSFFFLLNSYKHISLRKNIKTVIIVKNLWRKIFFVFWSKLLCVCWSPTKIELIYHCPIPTSLFILIKKLLFFMIFLLLENWIW